MAERAVRVLITGIDGFVGSHAAEYLLDIPGIEIHGTVLDRSAARNIAHLLGSLRLHQVDVTDTHNVLAVLEEVRPDRVIHLAGRAFVPDSLVDPVGTFHTNIIGGVSLLEAARQRRETDNRAPVLLMVSSGEVYGRVAQDPSVTEEFALAPTNPYAASKACIDLIAQQYKANFGLNVIIVRPFNHAGPRQNPTFVCADFGKQFAEIAAGKRSPVLSVGNLDAERDFTDVRDVVRAYWMLFEQTSTEFIFNVCSNRAVRIRELLSLFKEISGVTVEIVPKTDRLRPYDLPRVVGSYDRLHRATGWEPRIPLRKTLQDVFKYWSALVNSHQRESPDAR